MILEQAPPGPTRRSASAEILERVRKDLAGFSSSTEGLFLQVGERLAELQARAREIARQTASIAQLLSNDEGSLAVLAETLNSTGESDASNEVVDTVQGIQRNAKAVRQAIEAVVPLVNTWDALSVIARIESSRFEAGGATLTGLAEDVTALSRQVRDRIGTIADSAATLLKATGLSAEQVRLAAQTRRENLGPLRRQSGAELQKIRDHHSGVSRGNTLLATRFDGISAAVGDVVMALQSHDIVRQQIEHVVDALRSLDFLGDNGSQSFEIVRLQAAQLNNSQLTFERSVNQIRNALAQIEHSIGDVAEESAHLLISSDSTGESFIEGAQSGLAGIVVILESNATADRLLAEALVSVDQRVSEISRAITGMRAIGIEMQYVALNATIQAAKLGPKGAALGVVAHSIQELARDAGKASDTIEKILSAIQAAASTLNRTTATGGGSDVELAQLRRSAETLSCVHEKARAAYTRTIEMIAGLKRETCEAITAFGARNEGLAVLADATEALRDLSIDARSNGSSAVGQIASVYTMHSERAVHEALYDPVRQSPELLQASTLPAPQEDNVEFF